LGASAFVGLQNYRTIFADPVSRQVMSFTLSLIVVRLVVVAVVPPLLAWAVAQVGRASRISVRVLSTAPMVLYMPLAIALAWSVVLSPDLQRLVSSSGDVQPIVLGIDGLYTFGLACGLGLIAYLAVWHRSCDTPSPTWAEVRGPLIATWCLGLLATVAITPSSRTLSWVMTGGGPEKTTSSLALWQHELFFASFSFGGGAAVASLTLVVALVMGILGGLLVILTKLRLGFPGVSRLSQPSDRAAQGQRLRVLPLIALVVTLLPALGAWGLSALPFGWLVIQSLTGAGYAQIASQIRLGPALLYGVLPSLIAAMVQLPVAYLGALSVGAIRPLGRRSIWLLLPFSPWLFVTTTPLELVSYLYASKASRIDTLLGQIPPVLCSVPLLFVLTLFFRGQASHWQAALADGEGRGTALVKHLILPSVPLVIALFTALLFIGWQDLFWPLLVTNSLGKFPMSLAMLMIFRQTASSSAGFAALGGAAVTLLVLPMALFSLLAWAVLQIFYLDRLALRSGDEA